MKREPNPYSKNPMLTVTSTMSISVPSMVAEDVLDGTDAPVITTDPEVHGRIDAVSGAVGLMDTRIDAVSGAVGLMDTRIDAVSEVLALNGSGSSSGSSNVELTDDLKKLNFEGDWNNEVIYFSGNFNGESTELQYYALAAGAFANAKYPKSQLKVHHSGLLYTTADGGNTWTLVGSNNSSSENCVTFTDGNNLGEVEVRKEGDYLALMARTTDKSALAYYSLYAPHFYCGDHGEFEFRVVDVSNGSNVPGLQLRSYSGDWITITGGNSSSSGTDGNADIVKLTHSNTTLQFAAKVDDDNSAMITLEDPSGKYSGVVALSNALGAPQHSQYDRGTTMLVSGMGVLLFQHGDDYESYDLNNLGEDSAPAVAVEDSDADQAKRLALLRLNDSRDASGWGLRNYRLTAPGMHPSNNTAVTYALQTFLAATGLHETVGKYAGQAMRTRIALVEGVSQSSTPQFMWWDSGAYKYKKWEPWTEGGSTGGGGTAASDTAKYLIGENDSRSAIVPLISNEDLSYVSWGIANPSSPSDNIISGIKLLTTNAIGTYEEVGLYTNVSSINGSIVPKYTNGALSWCYSDDGWNWQEISTGSSGSAAGVYELGLLDNGNESASRMLPLVKEQTISDGTSLDILNWAIGWATSNAQETSGMYTLVGNPIALYDSAYRSPNDSRIKGAVRVVDMHGTICWQRYSYTAKQWMIEEKDPSFYWQETNKSTTSIVAVLSYPGYVHDEYAILINNPLYAGQYNSRPCAVRPYISSDGTLLSWKRRTESGDWTDVKASGTSGTTALCSYATILADRNAETADAVRKGITFGYHAGGDTTTLGYLQFADTLNSANDYKSIIAIEDLLWLGANINKLKALVN